MSEFEFGIVTFGIHFQLSLT